MDGIKGQDIVILLRLASLQQETRDKTSNDPSGESPYSVRGLGAALGISKTEVGGALNRIFFSGLAIKDQDTGRPKPNLRRLFDFIIHGLKFVFPAKPGAMIRGVPTAFAAPMLKGVLLSGGNHKYVWPSPTGREMGQSVEPLFKSVAEAVGKDGRLYEYLALVDAIRLGNQRESRLAEDRLDKILRKR